ncbi:DUF397 domain-containing protein [Streptomyces buecherae]|uniref:DUF397 domain-containing protein n=1 Tax=Streptomyces buecherae TaxID=2763006 RepID=UPI001C2657EF|nr:DUF397 domain-containing protein [Streptomyces buecherae]
MTEKWLKSSYSGNHGDCVEVGAAVTGAVPVRDSKDPHGPTLAFDANAWTAFVTGVKNGDFDA